jgi:hypothetical protein
VLKDTGALFGHVVLSNGGVLVVDGELVGGIVVLLGNAICDDDRLFVHESGNIVLGKVPGHPVGVFLQFVNELEVEIASVTPITGCVAQVNGQSKVLLLFINLGRDRAGGGKFTSGSNHIDAVTIDTVFVDLVVASVGFTLNTELHAVLSGCVCKGGVLLVSVALVSIITARDKASIERHFNAIFTVLSESQFTCELGAVVVLSIGRPGRRESDFSLALSVDDNFVLHRGRGSLKSASGEVVILSFSVISAFAVNENFEFRFDLKGEVGVDESFGSLGRPGVLAHNKSDIRNNSVISHLGGDLLDAASGRLLDFVGVCNFALTILLSEINCQGRSNSALEGVDSLGGLCGMHGTILVEEGQGVIKVVVAHSGGQGLGASGILHLDKVFPGEIFGSDGFVIGVFDIESGGDVAVPEVGNLEFQVVVHRFLEGHFALEGGDDGIAGHSD